MSKNAQQNRSEVFLGNETYKRGFNDGLNGRPKTIKKTHRHVHRYHIGYRQGQAEAKATQASALHQDNNGIRNVAYLETPGWSMSADGHVNIKTPAEELKANFERPSFWARLKRWLFG